MLTWELPLSPPETFEEMLCRMKMTEEQYFKYLKEIEEAKIDAAYASLI